MEITKRASFYTSTRGAHRGPKTFHIETDGAIVNVTVGLHDRQGRQVTRVETIPDDERRGGDGNGRVWVEDGARIVRLHEGETREDFALVNDQNQPAGDPSSASGAGGPADTPEDLARSLTVELRQDVSAGALSGLDAITQLTGAGFAHDLQIAHHVAVHLLINPDAELVAEPTTGNLTRILLAKGE